MQDKAKKPAKSIVLQHFEFAVITAVNDLGERAFPAEIARRLSLTLQRQVSLAQVFIALERLEEKGLVSSSQHLPEPVRGGRRRRIFKMETSGAQAIRNTAAAYRTPPSTLTENVNVATGKRAEARA